MAIHIVEEADRCLGCKRPRCQQGCPMHFSTIESYVGGTDQGKTSAMRR